MSGGNVERMERGVITQARLGVMTVGFEDVGLTVFSVAEGPCNGLLDSGSSVADGESVVAKGIGVGTFVEGHVGVLRHECAILSAHSGVIHRRAVLRSNNASVARRTSGFPDVGIRGRHAFGRPPAGDLHVIERGEAESRDGAGGLGDT